MTTTTTDVQDIQTLQKTEKDLLDSLETDVHLTPEQRQKLIDKINALADMRVSMYKTIGQTAQLYQSNVGQAQNTIIQQTAAVDIEERALNETKRRLHAIKDRNLQDLRIIENNRYFSDKYRDHAQAALALMIFFIGLIVINFFYKSGILPNAAYWALVIILSGYVAYNFWTSLFLMYRRNNMNYSEFDFVDPNPNTIPASSTSGDSSSSGTNANDPWWKPTSACVGSSCCTSGMIFDSEKNMCVVSADTAATTLGGGSTPAVV
jgi:hypothetical protein